MSKSTDHPGYYICDNCGKLHTRTQKNLYKLSYKGKVKHFCSFHCYNHILDLKDSKRTAELDVIFNSVLN